MSESETPIPTPKKTATEMKPEPTAKAPPKPGKWKRRLLKTLFGFAIAFLVFRLGIFLLLGFTLRKVANFYDLDLTYQKQEITLLGGDAGLWGVNIARRNEAKPFLVADYVHGNLSVLALLRTHIEIWRMEADGVSLDVTRTADGKIPLLELVMAQINNKPVAKTSTAATQPLDLGSPFKIDALRVHRLAVNVKDEAVTPAFVDTLNVDLRLSDIRNPEKPTLIEADLWSESILSALRFRGTGNAAGRVVKLDADFRGSGLNLMPVAQYLEPLGIKPVARAIDWSGKLNLSTDAGPTLTALAANIQWSDIQAMADSREVAMVKTVQLTAKSIDADGIALGRLTVDGVRVHADRSSNGRFRFAGIELASPAPATQPTRVAQTVSTPTATPTPTPTTVPTGSAAKSFFVTLDEFKLQNLVASFGDAAMSPPVALSLNVDELSTREVARDASGKVTGVPIKGTLRAPGLAEAISIDGMMQPFEAPFTVALAFKADHVRPDALKPYLQQLGLTSTLDAATLSGSLNATAAQTSTGGLAASVKVQNVLLQDANTRVSMPLIRAEGVNIEPSTSSIVASDIELVGPELAAKREADGSLRGLGFRYQLSPAAPSVAHPTTRPAVQPVELPPLPNLPRVEVKRLKWSGTKIELTDSAVTPERKFVLSDVGATLDNIVIDLSERAGETRSGKIDAWMTLPGMARRFALNGTLDRAPGLTRLNVDVAGEGLQAVELAPYLAPLGIEPQLKDGNVTLKLGVDLKRTGDALSANLDIQNLQLREGQTTIASVNTVRVDNARVEAGALAMDRVVLASPHVSATHLKDGSFESGGVRLLPAKTVATVAEGPVLPVPFSPIPLRVDSLKVTDLEAGWNDLAANVPVSLTLNADAELNGVALSLPGEPATFVASGSIAGIAEKFAARGKIDVDPAKVFLEAHLDASGITGSAIDGYLPPGIKTSLHNATFTVDAAASVLPVDDTGQSLSLSLRDLKLDQDGKSLANVPALKVDMPLVDLVKNEVVIDSLVVERASVADVGVMKNGTINLPGLSISPLPEDQAKPQQEAIVVTATKAGEDPELAKRLAAARKSLPLMKVNKLDVSVAHAGVFLEARALAAPIALENLRVTNSAPIQIGGAKADELPPVSLSIQTELSPLVKQIKIDLAAAPFANEASLVGTLEANQINGRGLLDLVPELAGLVDGSSLVDGSVKGSLDAKLRIPRRGPTDVDIRRGFDGEVRITDVSYRVSPDAEPVAGLESITLEGLRVAPAFAGGNVKLLTVNKPMARVLRDAEGIHVLGWTIKLPSGDATTQPADEAKKEEPAVAEAKKEPTPAPPGAEFKVDKLVVAGGDILLKDVSVDPPLVVPVNALDVEVKGLSNRALVENRAIRFSALVGMDKVELPTRAKRGETASAPTELRPLLSQVAATGKLSLFPALDGYTKASVNGFEMQSLIGEAKAFGVTVGDGIFDGTFDARFRDGGNLDLKSKLVVTDLKLSEQPNGMMQRVFKLPVPLDAAIGFAEDASGSITFPINAKIRGGEVDIGSVLGSIIGGVSEVTLKAIASAPLKVLNAFGGDAKPEAPLPSITLGFLPGDTSMEPSLRKSLDELILAMRKNPDLSVTLTHHLSAADSRRASVLASPSREQIDEMTETLRSRRMSLINLRQTTAARVSAELASGGVSESALADARTLDRQIVVNDDALDRLLELTRPGAELQTDRRMKAAAIDIASARLEEVRSYLAAAKLERAAERVNVVVPRFEVDESLDAGGSIVLDQIAKKRAK